MCEFLSAIIRTVPRFAPAVLAFCAGCVNTTADFPAMLPGGSDRRTIVVPGAFGDGPWYDGLRRGIAADDVDLTTFTWGLPKALFTGNFSDAAVHEKAERELAAAIDATDGRIDLVAHSAGCGVVLGALKRCHRDVGRVVLIAPSVSPTYDLVPALSRSERIDAFVSDRDTVFLQWRCGTFGTYDRVKSAAAGFVGFMTVDAKLTQHFYDADWRSLDNDGGHAGATHRMFVQAIVRPLLVPSPGTPGEG